MPDVRSARDVDILHAIAFTTPALGDPAGWHVRFGRELNATDDRRHFDRAPMATGCRSSKASTSLRSLSTSPARSCGLRRTWRRRWSIRLEHSGGARLGVSRGRVGDEPADAHRRHRARRHDHDAHGLLPQGPAGRRVPVVSVRRCSTVTWRTIWCGSASARTSPRASSIGCPCRHLDGTHARFSEIVELSAVARRTAPLDRGCAYATAPGARRARVWPRSAQFHHILETFPLVHASTATRL